MVEEAKVRRSNNRLVRMATSAPDGVMQEQLQATGPSRSSTLATLRCLAVLPVLCSGDVTAAGESSLHPARNHHSSSGAVKASHYEAYLQSKVSCAVSRLSRLLQGWEAAGPGAWPEIQLPCASQLLGKGGHDRAEQVPPPSGAAVGAVTTRKRTASSAFLEDPKFCRRAALPSSSLQHVSRASDECDTPSGPADATGRVESGWDGASEATGELPQVGAGGRRTRPHDFAAVSDEALGLGPAHGPATATVAAAKSSLAQRSQRQPSDKEERPLQPSARAIPAPAAAAEGPDCRTVVVNAGSNSGGRRQPCELAPPRPAYGPPATAPCSRGGDLPIPGVFCATTPPSGGMGVAPGVQLYHHHQQQQQPSKAEGRPPEVVARPLLAAESPGAGILAAGTAEPTWDASGPCRDPPCLCSLPAPSLTLQQCLSRRGEGAARSAGSVTSQPLPKKAAGQPSAPLREQPDANVPSSSADRCGNWGVEALMGSFGPGIRAAIEATAAATTSHWLQQLSVLPALNTVRKRWSLTTLAHQLASCAAESDRGVRSSCGGGGGVIVSLAAEKANAEGGGALLRHVLTPLPRQRADRQVDLTSFQGPGVGARTAPALRLEALAAPLPADTCPARADLWDLVRFNFPCAACSPRDGDAPPGGEEVSHASCALTLEVHEHAEHEESGNVDAEAGADDLDVFISSEALICLALLAAPATNFGGWRLPFMVRPRESAGGGRPAGQPSQLYFAEPLRDTLGLLLDSWSRICASALAGIGGGDSCPVAGHCRGVQCSADESEAEDCECCQQDEWQLGGLTLLVLSHCGCGLVGRHGRGEATTLVPAQLVALTLGVPRRSPREPGATRQQAAHTAVNAVDQRYPELVVRAKLLLERAATFVVVVDAADGTLLAQQSLDVGALQELAAQRGTSVQHDPWRLVHDLLSELRRLPPGPYILHMNASSHCLELLGADERPGPAVQHAI